MDLVNQPISPKVKVSAFSIGVRNLTISARIYLAWFKKKKKKIMEFTGKIERPWRQAALV